MMMRSGLAFLTALLAFTGCSSAGRIGRHVLGVPEDGPATGAVDSARSVFQRATETGNAPLLESVLAPEALLVTVAGDTVRGASVIARHLAPSASEPVPHVLNSERLDRCGSVAVDMGRVQVSGSWLLDYRIEWEATEGPRPAIAAIELSEYSGADRLLPHCTTPAAELFAGRSVVISVHPGASALWTNDVPDGVESSIGGDYTCGSAESDAPLLAASVRVRGPSVTSLELFGVRELSGGVTCNDNHPFMPRVAENRQASTIVGALFGVRWGNVRIAAGPALTRTAWQWRDASISEGTRIELDWSTTTVGAAADLAFGVPLTGRLMVEARWQEGWFPEQEVRPFRQYPGGSVRPHHRMIGLGLGIGF